MNGEQSDRFSRVILDSIAEGVFTVDLEFRITSFNRAAEEITGVRRADAIGEPCCEVFRADVCLRDCALARTLDHGEPVVDQPVEIIDAEGERIPISVSTAVLTDDSGRVVGGVETFRDLSEVELLRRQLNQQRSAVEAIVTCDEQMRRLVGMLPDVARSDSTVLLEGASGTGKGLFARAVHELSHRASGRLVELSCAALPETLLEAELFGVRRGAYTGADRDRPGRLDAAAGGTLFLDEISDLSSPLQVKLLRVLEDRRYEPLGSVEPQIADVRVVAATNRPLAAEVEAGSFRSDLFWRLNVVRLELPRLAERPDDIPLLVDRCVRRLNARTGRRVDGFDEEAMATLMRYSFPGNVRELENIVERAFVLCREPIFGVSALPPEVAASARPTYRGVCEVTATRMDAAMREGARGPLSAAEADTIRSALQRNRGHRLRTARELGIHPSTLWRKMKRHGLL